MRTALKLSHVIAVALLAVASAASSAATYEYRMVQKGVRAKGGTALPVGWPSGTPGAGTTDPTADPAGQQYATSGVQFLLNGAVITELFLDTLDREVITLRNTSSLPLRGWLLTSPGGATYADLAGSTCSQNTSSTVPVLLQPGAECNFTLVARATEIRTDDTYVFRSLENTVIPSTLRLIGNGGGLGTGVDM